MDNHNNKQAPHVRHILGFLAGNLHMGMAPRLWPGMIAKLQNRFEIRTQDVGGTSVMYVKVKE